MIAVITGVDVRMTVLKLSYVHVACAMGRYSITIHRVHVQTLSEHSSC